MNAIAVDPALRSTGVYACIGGEERTAVIKTAGVPRPYALHRIYRELSAFCASALSMHRGPVLGIVEGYAFSRASSSLVQMGESGGVVRLALLEAGLPVVEIGNTTWKRIVWGKGDAPKGGAGLVTMSSRFGRDMPGDVADAFCMYQAALTIARNDPGRDRTAWRIRQEIAGAIADSRRWGAAGSA